jgi:bifunctional enzyme CysN/CysC
MSVFPEMDLLRFSTAGSVDDGKSTLIGRLLYDTKSIFQDQLEAIESASRRRGEEGVNLALLTDGLRAEREQNITIDVAYRYFATPRRKFIIADTPGHVQYTRNMVTGASTAELTIVLVDARKGVLTQSRRHAFIASLLGIPHIVVAVNKMDAVDYAREVYDQIVAEYSAFAAKLDVKDIIFIPVSALHGDNIVSHSQKMSWYEGATLLHHLETVKVSADRNVVDFRFPVQYVIRPNQDFRGFAGRVASGGIRNGEAVVVLPGGQPSTVTGLLGPDGECEEAAAGDSVVLTLADEIDASRGSMIVRRMNLPAIEHRFDAMLCWLGESPLDLRKRYTLMHTSRATQALVDRIVYRVDVDTLHRAPADSFSMNEIGRVEITTADPLFIDAYRQNRITGSFILVDPGTNGTVAGGMIRGPVTTADVVFPDTAGEKSPNVVWQPWNIGREEREARQGHRAAVLWFTGLSGSGKSTIARELERRLFDSGYCTMLLDGDQLRHGLNADLRFGPADRAENVRRAAQVARLFFEQGAIVLCTFVSPYARDRELARSLFPEAGFAEIHVDAPLDELRRRDPKGLYKKADSGDIRDLTGVSATYETPAHPELVLNTADVTVAECVDRAWRLLANRGVIRAG